MKKIKVLEIPSKQGAKGYLENPNGIDTQIDSSFKKDNPYLISPVALLPDNNQQEVLNKKGMSERKDNLNAPLTADTSQRFKGDNGNLDVIPSPGDNIQQEVKTKIDKLMKGKAYSFKELKEWIEDTCDESYYEAENLKILYRKEDVRKIIEQAQTQTKLECLKEELEFLKEIKNVKVNQNDGTDIMVSFGLYHRELLHRIDKIQQEIKEIENGK